MLRGARPQKRIPVLCSASKQLNEFFNSDPGSPRRAGPLARFGGRAIAYRVSVPQMRDATDTTAVALECRAACRGGFQTRPLSGNLGSPDISRDWSSAQDLRKGGFETRPYKHPKP